MRACSFPNWSLMRFHFGRDAALVSSCLCRQHGSSLGFGTALSSVYFLKSFWLSPKHTVSQHGHIRLLFSGVCRVPSAPLLCLARSASFFAGLCGMLKPREHVLISHAHGLFLFFLLCALSDYLAINWFWAPHIMHFLCLRSCFTSGFNILWWCSHNS